MSPEVKTARTERIQGLGNRLKELNQQKTEAKKELAFNVALALLPKDVAAIKNAVADIFQKVEEGDHVGAATEVARVLAGENQIAGISIRILESIGNAVVANKGKSCDFKATALKIAADIIKNETGIDIHDLQGSFTEKLEEEVSRYLDQIEGKG